VLLPGENHFAVDFKGVIIPYSREKGSLLATSCVLRYRMGVVKNRMAGTGTGFPDVLNTEAVLLLGKPYEINVQEDSMWTTE